MEDPADSVKGRANQVEIEISYVSEAIHDHPTPPRPCHLLCAFSKLENDEEASNRRLKSLTKLCGLMILYMVVMLVEVVGGIKANSLAVLADAGHLLTDVVGLSVSLFAVWASSWKATSHYSFAYNRLEVLGALFSVQLIWVVSGLLLYEAVDRILHKSETVNGKLMFFIAAFGFIVNLIMVTWLGHDHSHHGCDHADHDHDHEHDGEGEKEELRVLTAREDHEINLPVSTPSAKAKILNINLQGVYLHVMADLIQSVGVMIAGAIIWWAPQWQVVDLMSTLIFSVLVLSTTLSLLKNVFRVLMEGTPGGIDVESLADGLKGIKGVHEVHDLHVWAITLGKIALSCHVVAQSGVSSGEIVHDVREYCERTYSIHHVTVQVE
ncbi:metal tolerance protein B isoform X2 [Rhodamnia argentea]|nr:metal tolerance protein B isoform X2 [Rhodamnia argentea]XP_030537617.1 metal tolerance protein B isoform X2 [Rhodamnia argentea]XP_030537618.1 metal tolerance protein B isoform X2 [Rhodamnia argentea]XP_030537620.1 metal tolerance protein B isoform X2 [Rhodamnia argentea]